MTLPRQNKTLKLADPIASLHVILPVLNSRWQLIVGHLMLLLRIVLPHILISYQAIRTCVSHLQRRLLTLLLLLVLCGFLCNTIPIKPIQDRSVCHTQTEALNSVANPKTR